jgi:hypothetical protein
MNTLKKPVHQSTKICVECHNSLPLTNFFDISGGVQNVCKFCRVKVKAASSGPSQDPERPWKDFLAPKDHKMPQLRCSLGYPLRVRFGDIKYSPTSPELSKTGRKFYSASGFEVHSWGGVRAYTMNHLCYDQTRYSFTASKASRSMTELLRVLSDDRHKSLNVITLIFTWAYAAGVVRGSLWEDIPLAIRTVVAQRLGFDVARDPRFLDSSKFPQQIYRPVGM